MIKPDTPEQRRGRDCFGSLDHEIMLSTLAEKIHDNRFLGLIKQMLQAGYLEDWIWNATLSGSPQGGVASPILSNVYLHKLDVFVETVLIPEYTRGKRKKVNPSYQKTATALTQARKRGDRAQARQLRKRLHELPSGDPHDPGHSRLRQVHEGRQTRPTNHDRQPTRLRDRQHLRRRVPRYRPVLPAGRQRPPTTPAAMGRVDLTAQNTGLQA